MARKPLERISQREYARRLSISNEAVRKAIEAKKIVKGWDAKAGKIIFERANEEWGNIHLQAAAEGQAAESEAIGRIQAYVPPPQSKKKMDAEDTQAAAEAELEEFNSLSLSARAPFAEALRVEKVAKAKQAVLELRERTGELVNKDEVYKQLFAFGQSVRQAVLAVPDRAIDEILAAPNRAESYQVLHKYLHEALEKLSQGEALENKSTEQ